MQRVQAKQRPLLVKSTQDLDNNNNNCCRASARQHTIHDVFLQNSFDPGFCADLCIVEISICFCPSVRKHFRGIIKL